MEKILFDILSHGVEQTEAFGAELGRMLSDKNSDIPLFIALYGDLGVGKTALTRGIASVISPSALVRSPTFALVNQYKSPSIPLFHFDMYRITDEDDLYSTGFYDYLESCERRRAICVVEWSENIPYALPESYLKVKIEKTEADEQERHITAALVSNT